MAKEKEEPQAEGTPAVDWKARAIAAEKRNAVVAAVRSRNWHSEDEAIENILALATLNEAGDAWVIDGKPLSEAVSNLAGAKPHWIKSDVTKSTTLGVTANIPGVGATFSYEQLLRPENANRLSEMISKGDPALQTLRTAHVAKLSGG